MKTAREKAEYMRAYNVKNRERINEKQRARNARNREVNRLKYVERKASRSDEYKAEQRLYARAYYVATRDRQIAAGKAYRAANVEKIKVRKKCYEYGITAEQFNAMLVAQNHSCAICERLLSLSKSRGVNVDHDHGTGAVRGLLCSGCNAGIGQMRDDVNVLKRAVEYLIRHGAKP